MRALRLLLWTTLPPLALTVLVPFAAMGGVLVTRWTGLRGQQAAFLAAQVLVAVLGFAIGLMRRDPAAGAERAAP